MAGRGRSKAELVLSTDERETLLRWSRRAKSAQALALRCRIVLMCAEGLSNLDVADRLEISRMTVGKWRSRFVAGRLDGLLDEDRPGRPPSIGLERIEDVVVATLEQTPSNATHWSRTSMAQRSGLSKSTIGRIWRDFGLSPHALAIAGPGASGQTSVVQPGGAGQELTVSLQPGMYELWCPVGNHRALGMTATMTVA